jgi:hypothetical protein
MLNAGNLAVGGSVSASVLRERGADEVGWEEPHEQIGESITKVMMNNSKQARVSLSYTSMPSPCAAPQQ